MCRAVVTVYALHLKHRERADRIRLGITREKGSRDSGVRVPVLDPWDVLPFLIGRGILHVHARAQVAAVNAATSATADQHHEDRLRRRVRFVVFVLCDDAKTRPRDLFARMALFTSFSGRSQAIALYGGFNGPWTWHLDPDQTQMVEAAIEVCDGKPSYVEAHKSDFPTYCPWSARIVGRK